MDNKRDRRALICYAGSAPEASIGSKPFGSELSIDIGSKPLKSQQRTACYPRQIDQATNLEVSQTIDLVGISPIINFGEATA